MRVLAGRLPLPPRRLGLFDALGCVLAAAVVAGEPSPLFTNSAIAGYALRAEDTAGASAELEVVGELLAGASFVGGVAKGQAVRIMTGAPLPSGCDAVCPSERTKASPGGGVIIDAALSPGENVRSAGSDVAVGQVVLVPGARLAPGGLGLLSSIGVLEVMVHPRPVVGVLSTGDELSEASGPLAAGKIRDSNRIALLGLLSDSGFTAVDLGAVGDDEASVASALLDGARRCDALITSGGVSVGDRDVMKTVLARLAGATMQWLQVAVRPGKPFAFGEVGPARIPVFGLPGNPVAAMVSFELFARPALRAMAGCAELDRPVAAAVADEDLARRCDGKLHLMRVSARLGCDGLVHVAGVDGQESFQLHAMAQANALALLPDGTGVRAGERVKTLLLAADELVGDSVAGIGPRRG